MKRFFFLFIYLLAYPWQAFSETSLERLAKDRNPRVALLGDSSSTESPLGFNQEVIAKLFTSIRENKSLAVFFLGDLVSGLREKGKKEEKKYFFHHIPESAYATKKRQEPQNKSLLQKQLDQFMQYKRKNLGEIPLYPLLGQDEVRIPDSVQILQKIFGIKDRINFGLEQLVYTVAIEDAYFVILSTNYFDEESSQMVDSRFSSAVLTWLDNELKDKGTLYHYLFVLGHEPAFSTTASAGEYVGLDKNPLVRDQFWKILRDNHVIAYFCSQENLYDRSFRDGVWQVITGGGGAALSTKNIYKAFYHYVLLTLPREIDQVPKAWVIDVNGRVRDEFDLVTARHPIFQLRISKNI